MFQISSPGLLFAFNLAYIYVLLCLFPYSLGFLKKSLSQEYKDILLYAVLMT